MTRRQVQTGRSRGGAQPQQPSPKEAKEAKEWAAKERDAAAAASHLHLRLPPLPRPMGELFYECTLFLYSAMALFCAYLNIYKALWWIPKAHLHYYAKLHLMDPHVLSCLGLILGRRVTVCFFRSIPEALLGEEERQSQGCRLAEFFLRMSMLSLLLCSFAVNAFKVVQGQGLASLGGLLLPLLCLYLLLFYKDALRGGVRGSGEGPLYRRLQAWLNAPTFPIDAVSARHACSSSPAQIRDEAALLSADLSQRLKSAFFTAAAVAWLSVWVPWQVTPENLSVDAWWMSELAAFVFLSALCLYLAYLFPLQYAHLLHEAVVHLGGWSRLGDAAPGGDAQSSASSTLEDWDGSRLWPGGSRVRHAGREWLATAPPQCWAAGEPGRCEWLEWLGSDPLRLLRYLLLFCLGLIGWSLLLLLHSFEWQHLVTLLLLLPANYLSLFFLFKDWHILSRLYHPSDDDISLARSSR